MAKRTNKGEGLTPLPTLEQRTMFVAKLLAPLPKGERHGMSEACIESELRDDERTSWLHALRVAESCRAAYDIADNARLRWVWDGAKIPPNTELAARRANLALAMTVLAIVKKPATSRAQIDTKRSARLLLRNAVFTPNGIIGEVDRLIAEDETRLPKKARGKAADDA
jgi:hypothetical protein